MFSTAAEMRTAAAVDYSQWTDEELMSEYQTGKQRAAFEELVSRYERELFCYLKRFLGNAESAEDLFQSTFLQVHLKCDQYDSERKFRPWLYRIATNQAITLRRKTKQFQVVSIDDPCTINPEAPTFAGYVLDNTLLDTKRSEQAAQVRDAMNQLPEILRQVLYLVYFQGMKYAEAAETLGVPFGTLKSRIYYAVKKLNGLLSEEI